MAKKLAFPVKQFHLPGGALSEKERVTVVLEALGNARGRSRVTGEAANVTREETASGSGKVSFAVYSLTRRPKVAGNKVQKKVRATAGAAKPSAALGKAPSKRATQKPQKSK